MTDADTRVYDLLRSITGCAFVVVLDESGLTPEDVADPKASLPLAARCADFVDVHSGDHNLIAPGVLDLAKGKASQARALIEHPDTAWWFDDLDPRRQAWLSAISVPDRTQDSPESTFPGYRYIYGTPPDTAGWRRPANPSGHWERHAQKPYVDQTTSTLYGPHLTSELIAYDERVGDYHCEFPLAWWSMRFPKEVRVFEIHGPSDWHNLCVRYPARDAQDDRLAPNWGAVSEEWDGVHLSLGGLLTAEQNRYESPAGWTMVEFWHAEQTRWLRPLKTETKRLPDYDIGMGLPEIPGMRFPDLGFGDEGMMYAVDPIGTEKRLLHRLIGAARRMVRRLR